MIRSKLHETLQMTQFLIEQVYLCDFSQIFPLLHPDITWVGLSEGRCLKGHHQVVSYALNLSSTPIHRLINQKFEMVPLSGNSCLVTGHFTVSAALCDGQTVVSRQSATFIWQFLTQSFCALHIHFATPFKLKEKTRAESRLLFHGKNGTDYLLSPSDILYIEADNIYCKFYTRVQCAHIFQPINQVEQIMPDYFIRIHRSYIVNKYYVEQLKRYIVTLKNGCTLPIPEKKYMQVKGKFQNNLLNRHLDNT